MFVTEESDGSVHGEVSGGAPIGGEHLLGARQRVGDAPLGEAQSPRGDEGEAVAE